MKTQPSAGSSALTQPKLLVCRLVLFVVGTEQVTNQTQW
jgi:hypothetical protein